MFQLTILSYNLAHLIILSHSISVLNIFLYFLLFLFLPLFDPLKNIFMTKIYIIFDRSYFNFFENYT
jgi:hypothetical protein